ncbi:MAG: hypothetical protein GY946_20005 [bacterium]|nr:hypothetical protein [bacterium]
MSARQAERSTWTAAVQVGAMLLTVLLAGMSRRATEHAVAAAGWTMDQVRLRLDKDYTAKIRTTFGPIRFPWFAFRDPSGCTKAPARALFPHHPQIRSSELLLEWECALASDHPFRKAAEALLFFSHGAADIEDTTIETHAVLVGSAIPQEWLYRSPENIREILRTRATRDTESGQPIIYASTDAHALRRYVDETWTSKCKMSNGVRLWCRDHESGRTIHIGGEYTWGDCHEVRCIFERLQTVGILPKDGDYGEGVVAAICFSLDGADWIAEHILPLFPMAQLSLDPYHVVEQVADAATEVYPDAKKHKRKRVSLVARARKALGFRKHRARAKNRKGRKKKRHKQRRAASNGSGQLLLDEVLLPLRANITVGKERLDTLIAYVTRNLHRLAYGELRGRGFQIGSGAMESLHRTASQVRLKRAGCKWTKEASQAILNLRMLTLSGRWDEYWSRAVPLHLASPPLVPC